MHVIDIQASFTTFTSPVFEWELEIYPTNAGSGSLFNISKWSGDFLSNHNITDFC